MEKAFAFVFSTEYKADNFEAACRQLGADTSRSTREEGGDHRNDVVIVYAPERFESVLEGMSKMVGN